MPDTAKTEDLPDFLSDERIIPQIGYIVSRECTPQWAIKDRLGVFNWWDLTYVTKGKAKYIIDGKDYILEEGDLLCFPPGHSRLANTFPDNLMHCFAVNFNLIGFGSDEPATIPLPLVSHIGLREDIIQLFNELVYTWIYPQPLYAFKVRSLFMLILHRFMETALYNINSSVSDSRVRMVLRYIATHYPEKITVKDMANLCGLDAVYFGALFKRESGMTVLQYVAKTRIRYAENFLRSGDFRVTEVAERCGYTDSFHFFKQFKQITGVAPSNFIPKKK
jgi:AraC-like DNA-binding protein